ncbi:MAG: DUF2079 domain-containing protein [Kiritimatiellae bacterium]|nr:DUF2079 domain-containing protein [Kiritimatiellia bacterium]
MTARSELDSGTAGRGAACLQRLAGLAALFCAAAVLLVIVWGGVAFTVSGWHIQLTHPGRPALLGLVLASLVAWRKRGLGPAAQVQAANDWLERRDRWVPWILALGAFVFLARIKAMDHWTFQTDAYDLALYDTAVRNTLHGRFLFADQLGRNFFSDHFSPILLLFCPLYGLADTPLTLMFGEALAVAAGLGVLYRIVRQHGLSPLTGLAVAGLMLNHRQMASAILYDFHTEVLGAVFLLGCIWQWRRGGMGYWIFLLLALSCKEDVPLYTAGLGAYVFLRGRRGLGLATCAVSVAWAVAAWKFIIPLAGQGDISPFVEARWSHLGNGYGEVAWTLLRRPAYGLSLLGSPGVRDLLGGFGWLSLAGFEALLPALPGVVLNASSSLEAQAGLQLYYAAPMLPFAAWGMVIGMARLKSLANRIHLRPDARAWLGAAGTGLLLLAAAGTFGTHYSFDSDSPRVRERHRIMRLIPEGATVSAESGFIPHLARTHRPYLFPEEPNRHIAHTDCEYILLDNAGDAWPLSPEALQAAIDRLRSQPDRFPLVEEAEGVLLFRNAARGAEP